MPSGVLQEPGIKYPKALRAEDPNAQEPAGFSWQAI
jgi:hypothetical protein